MVTLFTIKGDDWLQALHNFGDTVILECLHKENNVFFKKMNSILGYTI